MAYTQEEILKKYQGLPEDIQAAIFSVETAQTIDKIGRQNNLNIEKIGILADETGSLMLGLTRPNEYISGLTKRLGIEKEKARKIAEEMNKNVFSKIRESLKKLHGRETTEEEIAPKQKTGKTAPSPVLPKIIKPQILFGRTEEKEIKEKEKTVEEKPEAKKIPPEITPPEQEPKDIIQERKKEEIFRSKPAITEKNEKDGLYPKNQDPYREPIN